MGMVMVEDFLSLAATRLASLSVFIRSLEGNQLCRSPYLD
jgi:hypothetical protein